MPRPMNMPYRPRGGLARPRVAPRPTAPKRALKAKRPAVVKTKTKTKSSVALVRGQASSSRWIPSAGRLSLPKRVLSSLSGKNQYSFNMAARLTAADGLQNAYSLMYYDSYPVNRIFAAAPVPPTGNGNLSSRLLLKQSQHEVTFTNATNAICYVSIYDIFYKKDLEITADANLFIPEKAWDYSEKAEGNTLGLSLIGSYPSRSHIFNTYYAIKQKTTHLVLPGEVHKHKVILRPNRWITQQHALEKNYFAGLTAASMFVVSGTPVDNGGTTEVVDLSGNPIVRGNGVSELKSDGGAGGAPAVVINTFPPGSVVTTSPCALNITYSTRYEYQWFQDIDSDINFNNNLPTNVVSLDTMAHTGIAQAVIET